MRWWAWVILALAAAGALVFWWLSEQGKALEQDSYDSGSEYMGAAAALILDSNGWGKTHAACLG